MFNKFKRLYELYKQYKNVYPDPCYKCEVYLNEGCSFVDGFLCDYDDCNIRQNYINSIINYHQE